jgi:hypothetical protein
LTDRSSPRSWRSAASLIIAGAGLCCDALAATPRPIVECRPRGDVNGRIFRVVDRGRGVDPRWMLTLGSPRLRERIIDLPLPDAAVEESATGVTVASRSGNGGLAVTLRVAGDDTSLDVFVNFELEVNVWRDLSPDVEYMNTEGPLAHANCRILPTGEALP